ncbi:hypothetical protein GOV12_03960 [Candidatus Pacearchaeota archaeon]|nr:hypothetical protein [Candidatus Pacearchaeota archaeon]
MKDILDLIPQVDKTSKGALDLAQKIFSLQSIDPNIEDINFRRHAIRGYSPQLHLVARVLLKEPFTDIDQFREYLQEHNLPYEKLFDNENQPIFSFAVNTNTDDAFYAEFR